MSVKEKAFQLLEEKLKERPDLFLIDFEVSDNNDIKIILDGDHGVKVQDLVDVSRAIEHNMDREEEDFSLTVSSFDISKAFHHIRQYKKNLSRSLKIKTEEGEKEGKLIEVDEDGITIEYKMRVPKETGKGKRNIVKQEKIPFDKIKESKVVIKF